MSSKRISSLPPSLPPSLRLLPQIGGVKVDVYLNSPWPHSQAMNDEDSGRTGKPHRKPFTQCLKVLTSEQLFGLQEAVVGPKGPEEPEEDLVEFSFTEQQYVQQSGVHITLSVKTVRVDQSEGCIWHLYEVNPVLHC